MATHHGSKKWTLFGGGFEIDPLDNGRYRVTIRCKHHRLNEDYYYANKDEIFKAFGSAYDLPLDEGGVPSDWRPLDGEEYPDQHLVDTKYRYPQGSNVPILEFIYETLTDTWTNEIDDQTSSTDNGLRILERIQVAKPGTAAPYDEDDVGVVTITDGGKTLYLAGFDDKSTDRKGVFVTRWAEAGILNVQTPLVGGEQRVVVSCIAMTSAAVTSELAKVTANHELIDEGTGNYEGFQTKNYVFQVDDFEVLSATENGLSQLTRTQLATTSFTRGDVGTDTYSSLILAGEEIDNGHTIKKRVSRWAEAGLLIAEKLVEDGILYVTFTSQGTRSTPTALNTPTYDLTSEPHLAFTGGAAAPIYRARTRNVNGFKQYVTTVMLKIDGTALATGDQVLSVTDWEDYQYPGYVDTSFTSGVVPYPGGNVQILVTTTETLSTSSSVGATPVPFSIKKGCSININYIPTATGLAESLNKAFGPNYLAGAIGLAGSNTTFLGMDVDSIAGSGSSDPTYADFLATNNPILGRKIVDEFVTDEGVRWYRIRQKQLVDTFGDYN